MRNKLHAKIVPCDNPHVWQTHRIKAVVNKNLDHVEQNIIPVWADFATAFYNLSLLVCMSSYFYVIYSSLLLKGRKPFDFVYSASFCPCRYVADQTEGCGPNLGRSIAW